MVKVITRRGSEKMKPKCILDYNAHTSAVDRADQMMSYYSSPRKTIRWYRKRFTSYNIWSVTNAQYFMAVANVLNLVVQNSVMVNEIKIFIDKVRRIVQWFHQSGVAADQLRNSQKTENEPEGKIKHLKHESGKLYRNPNKIRSDVKDPDYNPKNPPKQQGPPKQGVIQEDVTKNTIRKQTDDNTKIIAGVTAVAAPVTGAGILTRLRALTMIDFQLKKQA
nr:unnamed protein product [Callosobruchus chinensis]